MTIVSLSHSLSTCHIKTKQKEIPPEFFPRPSLLMYYCVYSIYRRCGVYTHSVTSSVFFVWFSYIFFHSFFFLAQRHSKTNIVSELRENSLKRYHFPTKRLDDDGRPNCFTQEINGQPAITSKTSLTFPPSQPIVFRFPIHKKSWDQNFKNNNNNNYASA